jgi:hypothetical protein
MHYFFQANILQARQFNRRYADQGIVVTAANPGNLRSELQRHLGPVASVVVGLLLHPVELGAITQLYCNTAPETKTAGGEVWSSSSFTYRQISHCSQYFWPWARPAKSNSTAENGKLGEELWTWLESELKPYEN